MSIKTNRKAYFDYEVIDTYEAGIELFGWEVKSIKAGNVELNGNYVVIRDNELWVRGMNVGNWVSAPAQSDEIRLRERKLLLHKSEIARIVNEMQASKRLTMVILDLFLNHQRIKAKIGLVRGKRQYEKREKIKRRDVERDIKRELKNL